MAEVTEDFELDLIAPDELEIVDNQGVEEEAEVPFYTITSYGADYPIDGLVRRIRDGSIFVPTFQRGYVWSLKQASRFIESLLLGLPVPGIFLSREKDTNKLLVIDGQQRLRTLQFFYEGLFVPTNKGFTLMKVQKPYLDATYKTLVDEDRRRLDDSILHATVVTQETPSEDDSSIYQIFERLNTGGIRLSSQEIRTCIYHGSLVELLRVLNEIPAWRAVYGPTSRRMRDQELILRFLALHFGQPYEEYMREFVNKYMRANRYLAKQSGELITLTFNSTVDVIGKAVGQSAFRPKGSFNAAVFDAVMVGVARRLRVKPIEDLTALAEQYAALMTNQAFVDATETGTAHQESVVTRLQLATDQFADVP